MGASNARGRASRRGYTAVEIMLSIAVLGIGAAGVMTMQAASVQGNSDAHMLDMGSSIAREWIERLRRDSMTWTMPDDQNPNPNWASNTTLISQIGLAANAGKWVWPAPPTGGANTVADPGYGRAFDILGRDLALPAAAQPGIVFCTNIRGDWLVQDQLIRAEVRVYWLRQLFAAPTSTFCATTEDLTTTGTAGAAQVYHFIYAATAIARNAPQ
jgi:prepilin-type N-terminal cleavage/methylation domain-containing protein